MHVRKSEHLHQLLEPMRIFIRVRENSNVSLVVKDFTVIVISKSITQFIQVKSLTSAIHVIKNLDLNIL